MSPRKRAKVAEPQRFTFESETHGAGGFAKVIKGRDNDLERDIAVKVLDPLATKFSESDQERFRREARILARLSHPNIPAIYDVVFSPGTFLIVFQFVEGSTLRKVIDEQGPCDIGAARTWFQDIAAALEHAHGLAIVHRDVKPENIIVTPNRESAYLVDFGIALSTEEAKKLTESGFVIGTPGYMSPEQQGGEDVDWRSDIYSLGVTLYEALAGKPIPVGQYEELSAANEAIPPQIDDLIRDCLLPKGRRLDSARAFTSRLSGALRPLKPLSEVLAHGRLHELASAIEELNPEEFIKLPEGQRALVLVKVSDIIESGDPQLEFASERFLELLVVRGVLLESDEYRQIVVPAIQWGFERTFDGHLGRDSLRRALERAAYSGRAQAHQVLCDEFGKFLKDPALDEKDDWYLHAVRRVLQTLLANPACTSGAADLVDALKRVNRTQRSRSSVTRPPLE